MSSLFCRFFSVPTCSGFVAVVGLLLLISNATPVAAQPSSVTLKEVLGGYTRPILVTHAPGGGRTLFIVEQGGRIERARYRAGRWEKLGTFLDLSARVSDPGGLGNNERGLLGLAFHPDYRANGLFYVNYTRRGTGGGNGDTVVAEYRRLTSRQADPQSRRQLLVVGQPFANHNGGHLAFGPDGLLYIGLGDGGDAGDPLSAGQDLGTRLGKLLRIDPQDPDGEGGRNYRTPMTNPLVGGPGVNDIWAWGLRNPWRFSFDRVTGDLWIGDVGQRRREEINLATAGESGLGAGRGVNFGWNVCEGGIDYPNGDSVCTTGDLPVYDYPHGPGDCSVTGGQVHRGPSAGDWHGLYLAGDFCGRLFVLDETGQERLSRTTRLAISSFGEDAAGRIFLTDLSSGRLYRVRLIGPRP